MEDLILDSLGNMEDWNPALELNTDWMLDNPGRAGGCKLVDCWGTHLLGTLVASAGRCCSSGSPSRALRFAGEKARRHPTRLPAEEVVPAGTKRLYPGKVVACPS